MYYDLLQWFSTFFPWQPWLRTTDIMNDIMNLSTCSLVIKHVNFTGCCAVTDTFSLFLVSVGIRWMIRQTEIDKSSNYGNKERQINNNWKTVIYHGNKIMLLWSHEGIFRTGTGISQVKPSWIKFEEIATLSFQKVVGII